MKNALLLSASILLSGCQTTGNFVSVPGFTCRLDASLQNHPMLSHVKNKMAYLGQYCPAPLKLNHFFNKTLIRGV